jgi:hypothetical protein
MPDGGAEGAGAAALLAPKEKAAVDAGADVAAAAGAGAVEAPGAAAAEEAPKEKDGAEAGGAAYPATTTPSYPYANTLNPVN